MNTWIRRRRRPAFPRRTAQVRGGIGGIGGPPGRWAVALLCGSAVVLPLFWPPPPEPTAPAAAGSLVFALAASGFEPEWRWPLAPDPPVLRTFQPPAQRWLAGHRGVDFPAPPGTPVLSPAAGTVVFTGWVVDRPVLTVDLGGGLLASFEPVRPTKAAGEAMAEGEVLGHVAEPAAPGHCEASCLHWGVRLRGIYLNPLSFVTDRRPSVLLPLRPPASRLGEQRPQTLRFGQNQPERKIPAAADRQESPKTAGLSRDGSEITAVPGRR